MSEKKITLEEVKTAINILYKGDDVSKKDEVSRWLEHFQQSVHAWELSSQLLHLNIDAETSYFAAQTMRTKIQFHFSELPIDTHTQLKDSLMQHLKTFQKDLKSTVTQLCLALADLAVQSPQWKDPVNEIIQRFSTSLEELPFLLEILAYLPEEAESSYLKLGLNRREEFIDLLRGSSQTVLHLLVNCQNVCPSDEKVQSKIFYCFGSWLELRSFPSDVIANSQLLRSVFETLLAPTTSTSLHDTVTDCICSALYISEDASQQKELAELCFNFVMSLAPAYEKSVQDSDLERGINYARLFTEMACTLLYDVLNTPGKGAGSFKTIEMLLLFLDHPEYEVADITFRFWYRFAESLYKECPDSVVDVFRPYVQTLIMKLTKKCQMDADHEGKLSTADDFMDFRFKATEVVQDTVFICGYTTSFLMLLKEVSAQGTPWNVVEAGMFVMRCIANKVSQRSEPNVGEAVKLIVNLPQNAHIALKYSAIELLAELTPWVDQNPQHIGSVFQFILNSLQDHEQRCASAIAFEHLCVDCCSKMASNFPVVLQVVNAIDELGLPSDKANRILRGAAHVLSRLPYDEIKDGLTQLLIPQVTKLNQILQAAQDGSKKPRGHLDPVLSIDRLSTVFRYTAPRVEEGKTHPCQTVIEELWPLLSGITNKFKADERIMERVCRCLRFAIRCVGDGFRNLLQPFVEQVQRILYGKQAF